MTRKMTMMMMISVGICFSAPRSLTSGTSRSLRAYPENVAFLVEENQPRRPSSSAKVGQREEQTPNRSGLSIGECDTSATDARRPRVLRRTGNRPCIRTALSGWAETANWSLVWWACLARSYWRRKSRVQGGFGWSREVRGCFGILNEMTLGFGK